jgi:hypothetical protein
VELLQLGEIDSRRPNVPSPSASPSHAPMATVPCARSKDQHVDEEL